ncbi:MAG: lysophospholipid acyltransferase family protein [Cyclobacteriaceae bacterium]
MFFIRLISRLPLSILYGLSFIFYVVMNYIVGYRKKVITENMKICFPEKSEQEIRRLRKGFYKNLSYVFVEIMKTLTISKEELMRRCKTTISPELQKHLDNGGSMLYTGGHICNWEWYMPLFTLYSGVINAPLYKPVNSPFFEKLMFKLRSRFGVTPLPMQTALREIIKNKKEQRSYGFGTDQSPQKGKSNYFPEFFGIKTPFYVGVDQMAKKLQYPVAYGSMKRVKRGYYTYEVSMLASTPHEVGEKGEHIIIEKFIERLEQDIKDSPTDWLWSHRRFKHSVR